MKWKYLDLRTQLSYSYLDAHIKFALTKKLKIGFFFSKLTAIKAEKVSKSLQFLF